MDGLQFRRGMRVNARTESVQHVLGQWYLKTQENRVGKRGDSKEGETSEDKAVIGFICALQILKELGDTVTVSI